MKNYKNFTIVGNRARANTLRKFRKLIINYFNNSERVGLRDVRENEEAAQSRSEINLLLKKAYRTIREARVSTVIFYTPPPITRQPPVNFNVMHNIFNSRFYEVRPQDIVDFIDKALGVYECDKIYSIFRAINPLFWLNQLFQPNAVVDFIVVSIPILDNRWLQKRH